MTAKTPTPDEDYVKRREALIPRAEAIANEAAGAEPPRGDGPTSKEHAVWAAAWNRAFHGAMDRLSAEAERRHDDVGRKARSELMATVRRWKQTGLTLGEAVEILKAEQEALS